MIVEEALLLADIIIMSIAIFQFIQAAKKARRVFSIISKIMIAFTLLTIVTMDHVFAYFLNYVHVIPLPNFITYRFSYELAIGIIGFYFLFELKVKDTNACHVLKFSAILIPLMLAEAYFIYFFQNPLMFNEYRFVFLILEILYINPVLFFVLCIEKIYSLVGIISFCVYVCYIIISNKFYSRTTKILLSMAVLSFINIPFTIPIIESYVGEIYFVYLLWFLTFSFVILARLTKINFEAISGINEVLILYKDGRPIFSTGTEKLDPELVGGAISAITSFLEEVLHSKEKVRSIDHQDKKLLFAFGKYTITTVISDKESQIIQSKVSLLSREFEKQYQGILEHWNGNIGYFSNAWMIIDKIFPISEWQHEIAVNKFLENIEVRRSRRSKSNKEEKRRKLA
ncbi:MAG: hypothetical protein ACXQS8_10035 [Candidatus Helarchaeales archaeon]